MLSLSERAGLGRVARTPQRLQSLERTCTMHVEDRGATTIPMGRKNERDGALRKSGFSW